MEHIKHITPFGLPPSDLLRIQETSIFLQIHGEQFSHRFYELLFAKAPEFQAFFPPFHRAQQQAKFLHGLEILFSLLEQPHKFRSFILTLGKRHAAYGIGLEHYPPVLDALLTLISDMLGDRMNPLTYQAWENFFHLIRAIMLEHLQDKEMGRWRSLRSHGLHFSEGHKRILLLDDDHHLLHLYQSFLEIQGYVCSRVSDLDWTLTHLQMSRYDLVLSDFRMPRMNGIQVKNFLNEAVPTGPPWVLLTGDLGKDIYEQALEAGFVRALGKPRNLEELRTIIEEALKSPMMVSSFATQKA